MNMEINNKQLQEDIVEEISGIEGKIEIIEDDIISLDHSDPSIPDLEKEVKFLKGKIEGLKLAKRLIAENTNML